MENLDVIDLNCIEYFEYLLSEWTDIPKSDMFQFVQTYTNNFEKEKFKYFIIDLREFVYKIPFALKKEDSDILNYDDITGEVILFLATGEAVKDYHFNVNNDFTDEQWKSGVYFEEIQFDQESSLSDRIDKLKIEISNLHFKCRLDNILKLSEISECQYNVIVKTNDNNVDNKFETSLADKERLAMCQKIISESESDIETYKKIFIGSIDFPTLMYLLGGERPEKIVKMRMTTHQKVYDLLLEISNHINKDNGKIYVPNFVKKVICPEVLLNRGGKPIKKLNENVNIK